MVHSLISAVSRDRNVQDKIQTFYDKMVSLYVGLGKKVWILFKFGFRNKSKLLDLFRHSKAMHLLQSGVNLIYIRDFLGHSDCSTTEIYARADSEMKRKAIENAFPDLVPHELPKWEEDGDLMRWLNSLCD